MFRVGQKVVCVDDECHGLYTIGDLYGLERGRVYTVRSVGYYRGFDCIWLSEIVRPVVQQQFGECGFSSNRFRPVVERKTDISIFTSMLNPTKEPAI